MATSTERVLVAAPTRINRSIVAPLQLQLTSADQLRVNWKSSITGTDPRLFISYRILNPDGTIVNGLESVTVAADYTTHSAAFQLREGYLLALTISSSLGAQIGQIWVQAYVFTGQLSDPPIVQQSDIVLAPLVQGFVTHQQQIVWPGSLFTVNDNAGWYDVPAFVGTPGAGTDWTLTAQSGANWRLVSVVALFTASGVAGNRNPQLSIRDAAGVVVYWNSPRSPDIIAGASVRCCWSLGSARVQALTVDAWNAELPQNFKMFGGVMLVRAATLGLLAGDQWSAIRLQYQEQLQFA